jgi:hypothetical protein
MQTRKRNFFKTPLMHEYILVIQNLTSSTKSSVRLLLVFFASYKAMIAFAK